jgi:hypothetical protein
MTTNSQIRLDVEAGIATLTLDRPEKRNAISDAMRTELIAALEQVAADTAVRALVLTGTGKGFCAGGDVAGMQRRMEAPAGAVGFNGWTRQQRVHHSIALLHNMPKPVIAAVNGSANGLGADMALACDFVIASEEASFAWSYIKRGLIPDGAVARQAADLHRAQGGGGRGAAVGHHRSRLPRRRTAARSTGVGARALARVGGGAGAGQVDHRPQLRAAGRAGVRAGEPGAGHLLYDAGASGGGAGLS